MKTIAINKTLEIHKPVEFPRFGVESVKVPQIGEKVYVSDDTIPIFIAAYYDVNKYVQTEFSFDQEVDKQYALYVPRDKALKFGAMSATMDGERYEVNMMMQITQTNIDEIEEMFGSAKVGDSVVVIFGNVMNNMDEYESVAVEIEYDGKTYNWTIK